MFVQYVFSFVTAVAYLMALLYSTPDLDAVLARDSVFPLADIYHQATGSKAATVCLLAVALIPTSIGCIGCFAIVGRTFWTLSRDNATPFSTILSQVGTKTNNPFNAVLLCGVLTTLLGSLYLASARAFDDLAASFVILTSLSYLAAILPHLLSGRSNIAPGWFWMKGLTGYLVNAVSCLYIVAFAVIFCFPPSLPTTTANMNYSSLIVGGISLFVATFWYWRKEGYRGPQYVQMKTELI